MLINQQELSCLAHPTVIIKNLDMTGRELQTEGKPCTVPFPLSPLPPVLPIWDSLEDEQHQRPPNETKCEHTDLQMHTPEQGCKGWAERAEELLQGQFRELSLLI